MSSLRNTAAVLLAVVFAAFPLAAQDSTSVRDSLRWASLDSAKTLPRVVVRAAKPRPYAPASTRSATKTDLPLIDVPQTVSIVAAQLMADQSVQTMTDVVRYIPGITMGQGEGHRDAPTIRGNSSTADFFIDGIRDDAQYFRDLYNVERVEALKGSNAMVFGRGGGGGVINRVTKDAQWSSHRSFMYEGGSFAHRRATVDVGDAVSRSFAGRINGMLESSGDFRNATSLERQGINPTASLFVGQTLVRAGYEHFADRRTVNRGIPSFRGRPSDADVTAFFGNPDQSNSRVSVHTAGATIERGSMDGVLVRNATRFAAYDKFYQNIYPGALNASGSHVSLSGYSIDIDRSNLFNQTDAVFSVGRGYLRQTFLIGAELGRQTTDSYRRTAYFAGDATTLSVPFDAPTVSAPATFRQSASDADQRMTAGVSAAFVQDQIELGAHWLAVAGLRLERFEVDFHDNRRNQNLFRADRMLSPRFGLVFKPRTDVSIYGSHSVSSLPSAGDQFSSLTVTNSTLEPERFVNREVGAKWDLPSGLAVTGALYQLDRSNSAAPDPLNSARVVQTGRQRTVGVETGINGRVTDRWDVAGGYAWQHARLRSRTTAAHAGAVVPLVPWYTLSLWNRYRFSSLVAGGVGVIRQDEMYAAIDNSVTLPAFTRVDAALFLSPGRRFRAQLNVENVLGVRYFPTSHGNNNILPGAPRTLRVSLTATP